MRKMVKRLLRSVGLEVKRYRASSGRPSPAKPRAAARATDSVKTEAGYDLKKKSSLGDAKKSPLGDAKKKKKKKKSLPQEVIYPRDFDEERKQLCQAVRPFTMTNAEKLNAAVEAVEYVVKNGIEGAIVECGVWKGGSSMAMAMTMMRLNAEPREFFLFDTFTGMPAPTDSDISVHGKMARDKFDQTKLSADSSEWARSPLDEVKLNMAKSGYPEAMCRFVQGKVEETIPAVLPEKIAILRLDTDWYESTKHEMVHLFPRLVPQGILIVDDYGHWLGSKKAVDEYVAENNIRIFLSRIDYSCRVAVKL